MPAPKINKPSYGILRPITPRLFLLATQARLNLYPGRRMDKPPLLHHTVELCVYGMLSMVKKTMDTILMVRLPYVHQLLHPLAHNLRWAEMIVSSVSGMVWFVYSKGKVNSVADAWMLQVYSLLASSTKCTNVSISSSARAATGLLIRGTLARASCAKRHCSAKKVQQ